jgi:hypothetical protein
VSLTLGYRKETPFPHYFQIMPGPGIELGHLRGRQRHGYPLGLYFKSLSVIQWHPGIINVNAAVSSRALITPAESCVRKTLIWWPNIIVRWPVKISRKSIFCRGKGRENISPKLLASVAKCATFWQRRRKSNLHILRRQTLDLVAERSVSTDRPFWQASSPARVVHCSAVSVARCNLNQACQVTALTLRNHNFGIRRAILSIWTSRECVR